MKARLALFVAAALSLLAAAFWLVQPRRLPEPAYQGKPASVRSAKGGSAAYATIALQSVTEEKQRTNAFSTIMPALVAAVNDRDDGVSQRAIAVLYRLGPTARSAIPAISKVLQSVQRHPTLRAQAAIALGEING